MERAYNESITGIFFQLCIKWNFINIINIGPGDGDEGHRANEKMLIADLSNYYKILFNFLTKLQNK